VPALPSPILDTGDTRNLMFKHPNHGDNPLTLTEKKLARIRLSSLCRAIRISTFRVWRRELVVPIDYQRLLSPVFGRTFYTLPG
jgi:hypothetical protein